MNTTQLDGFNVRVYAVCVHENKLLTVNEMFNNQWITKLPGGGLEFGEGPLACLKRELLEELNLEIETAEPFYIQEEYFESFVNNNKQIVILYFKVTLKNLETLKIQESNINNVNWIEISEPCKLSLPIDKQMFSYLINLLK
ncbi:NUDIX domain-containing protein [Flavobacterium agricola]|uniref:NUDIX domain-containing protein n=1 Tax=Flavobacterium agricola TaxID=2870839 RepID=A0ABY6LZW9_9FLAO|nr:NUDIX domain-containing protein [Flavobacterium agricola]UYW01848.1 NUDIX domain-containing protein [Flavobacterium agricola]